MSSKKNRERARRLLFPKIVNDSLLADWMWKDIEKWANEFDAVGLEAAQQAVDAVKNTVAELQLEIDTAKVQP